MSSVIRKRFSAYAVVLVAVVMLAACSNSSSDAGHPVDGGTATFALPEGTPLNWILPLLNVAYTTPAIQSDFIPDMWRPLYWFGSPGGVGLNEKYSLAYPAKLTTNAGRTTATITLKSYRWSDGRPVTTRDIQFWFDLLKVAKTQWWDYVAGEFPDNVTAFHVTSPTTFTVSFNKALTTPWIYNELAQFLPIPQQAWDKESAGGPVGNYDLTPAGATAVVNFLLQQNKAVTTYAKNPLWQVVDGPWKLQSITASGGATLVRNHAYSGPGTGNVARVQFLPFTSNASELDELLAGHAIDYGYIPLEDAPEVARVKAAGYDVQPWIDWGMTFMPINYANPQSGPLVKQLYIRQAMQTLIDQPVYVKSFFHGYAVTDYGPVPPAPKSAYLSAVQASNPYPYSPPGAVKLLQSHGWAIHANGADVCERPGTASAQCGAGIRAGEKLSLTLLYSTGNQALLEEVTAMQSAFSTAGIDLNLQGETVADISAQDTAACTKPSCWEFAYPGTPDWVFAPQTAVPDGTVLFASYGGSNGGAYRDTAADHLMSNIPTGGVQAVQNYDNYLSRQLPDLWMPVAAIQVSAISNQLQGALPQDPMDNIYPENWKLAS